MHDPVCGMEVTAEKAAGHTQWKGETIYFCSPGCLEKFNADPEEYIGPAAGRKKKAARPAAGQYTCPMHPEIVQDGPGDCPNCGMALEPLTGSPPKRRRTPSCAT